MKKFLLSISFLIASLAAFCQPGVKISALPRLPGNGSGGIVPIVLNNQTVGMEADSIGAKHVEERIQANLVRYDPTTISYNADSNWISANIGGSSIKQTITWSVVDSISTPPSSPLTGSYYLVGTSPTGLFSGHAKQIGRFDSTNTYVFKNPVSGDLLYNAINSFVSQWDGTNWIRITIPSALSRYQRGGVVYADPVTGVLKTDSTKLSFSDAGDLSIVNAAYFNFGRASLTGSFGGLQINVGSGFAGTSVDASKSIIFSNRGTEYGKFYSASGVNYFRVKTNVGFQAYGSSSSQVSSDTSANKPAALNTAGDLVRMNYWPGGGGGSSGWGLNGNAGTSAFSDGNPTMNFIGTTDNKSFTIATNFNQDGLGSNGGGYMSMFGNGYVSINGPGSWGSKAIALGGVAMGQYSIAVGTNATAAEQYSVAIGGATADGENSIAINGRAVPNYSVVIGDSASINPVKVGIGTSYPSHKLDLFGDLRYRDGSEGADKVLISDADGVATWTSIITANQFKLSALNTAPASSSASGTAGEIRITATFIYVCTATNTWVRSALTTW